MLEAVVTAEYPFARCDGKDSHKKTCYGAGVAAMEVIGSAMSQLVEQGLQQKSVVGGGQVAQHE